MSELPVKPPPPPRGDKAEMTFQEFSQAVDDVTESAGPPEIQADPTKGVRGSWDENGNYWQPAKAKWTFSEHCHAITTAWAPEGADPALNRDPRPGERHHVLSR